MGQSAAELLSRWEAPPAPERTQLEQEIVWTPATPRSVFVALRDAWNANIREMGGPATTRAIVVLLAQWAIETEEGRKCWNWNLPNIRCAHPQSQYHFYRSNAQDLPVARAEVMAAAGYVTFRDDKDAAAPGRLRVWIRGDCFRHWFSLQKGAEGYLATLRAFYRPELRHVRRGDPVAYAKAISDEARGKGRGFYAGPAEICRDGRPEGGYAPMMLRAFKDYMKAHPAEW